MKELKLLVIYKPLPGFMSLSIVRYIQGSVVVDYRIKVSASADSDKVLAYLREKKVELENSVIFRGYNLTDDYLKDHGNYFLRSAKTTLEYKCSATGICPTGYVCKKSLGSSLICEHKCNNHLCLNGGICYLNESSAFCNCTENEKYIYSGMNCELVNDKQVEVKNDEPLIIGVSVSAGIILIVLLICLGFCSYKRYSRTYSIHEKDEESINVYHRDTKLQLGDIDNDGFKDLLDERFQDTESVGYLEITHL